MEANRAFNVGCGLWIDVARADQHRRRDGGLNGRLGLAWDGRGEFRRNPPSVAVC
jgi:hypothetical protein